MGTTDRSGREYVVLVVDDDQGVRDVLAEAIEEFGIDPPDRVRVERAGGATDAEQVLARVRPDLVLLDLHLPDVDGFAYCRRLTADPRLVGAPVVVVSAPTPRQESARRAREAGCVAFLSKPFQLDAMLTLVATLLHRNARSGPAPSVG